MNQGDKTKDIMAQTTDQMLSLALEIEGLILLIQRRGDLVHPGEIGRASCRERV